MKIFILEDEIARAPRNAILQALEGHALTVATDIFTAADLYRANRPFDLLLLDHDMHGRFQEPDDADTGYQFVKWLTGSLLGKKPPVILHSINQKGRRAMASLLFKAGHRVIERPFSPDYIKFLKENIAL